MTTQSSPHATLVGINGELKTATFALVKNENSLGRDAANDVVVNDTSVSRQHCIVARDEHGFKIRNLASLNGTFVNGQQVQNELPLAHNDRVRIGNIEFVFLFGAGEAAKGEAGDTDKIVVQFDETPLAAHDTRQVRLEDAAHLMARDLSALMKISTRINSLHSLAALQQELLALICEVVPAERAAILLVDEHAKDFKVKDFASVCGWQRSTEGNAEHLQPSVRVSRTVVEQVARKAVAIISNDALHDVAFQSTNSLIAARTASFLAVPLIYLNQIRGVLYLDTTDLLTPINADYLPFVTAIANIAAVALENVRRVELLKNENEQLRQAAEIEHNMIGESGAMQEVYRLIARVAPTDATVLIRGESGTGKELAARAIHTNSLRTAKPFVAINCAALTETLLESELFGHEKGAFTGAVAQKKGKLEVADGGTLFLDEIAELATALQAKLLRVLQERNFERVGGTRTINVDVRLLAATNKDLEESIARGTFRADLYYRLNVVSITMPPLRERKNDLLLLANHFAAKSSLRGRRHVAGISRAAQEYLTAYDFPGNVRELENAIERAVVLGSTEYVLPEDLPEALLEVERSTDAFKRNSNDVATYHEAIRAAKKELIIRAVEQANYNYTEAAKLLDVHPNYLHRLIRNLNVKTELEAKAASKAH